MSKKAIEYTPAVERVEHHISDDEEWQYKVILKEGWVFSREYYLFKSALFKTTWDFYKTKIIREQTK